MINSITKFTRDLFKKIDVYHLFLIIIVLFGIWMRFTNLEEMVWEQNGNDESRDMLVAEHIVFNGEKPMRGPLAAGGFGWLLNSPIYFYVVSIIWSFTKTPPLFMKAWAILLGLLPLIAYQVGKEIKNKQLGLITALIFAISAELIHESQQLLQPFFLPIFSTLFLWAILKTHKNNNYFYLSAAIAFLLASLHFHYGVFLILPTGLFLVVKYWKKLLEKDFSLKNVIVPSMSALSVGFLWVLLTYRRFLFDQVGFFILNSGNEHKSILYKSGEIFLRIKEMVFLWEKPLPAIVLMVVLFLLIIFSLLLEKNKNDKAKISIVVFLATSALFMFFSNGFIADTYLLSTLPFFLIMIAVGIYQLLKFNYWIGLLFLIIIPTRMYMSSSNMIHFHPPKTSFYEQKGDISEEIFNDYFQDDKNKNPDFALAFLKEKDDLPFDGWGTTSFWFHLEKMTGKQLVKITNYGVNIKPLVDYSIADAVYLVCEHRGSDYIESANGKCLNRFSGARDYIKPDYKIIFQSNNHTVWKFNVMKNKFVENYNHTYPDLLNQ